MTDNSILPGLNQNEPPKRSLRNKKIINYAELDDVYPTSDDDPNDKDYNPFDNFPYDEPYDFFNNEATQHPPPEYIKDIPPKKVPNNPFNQYQQTNQIQQHNSKSETRFIDDIIKTLSNPEPYIKRQALGFYNHLKINQPQLNPDELYHHIDFFLRQPDAKREEQLKEFGDIMALMDTNTPRLFKIINSSLDTYHKKIALNKLQTLESMKPGENEYFKLSQWIDNFIDIPFNTFQKPKYNDDATIANPAQYLANAREHLNNIIYGQKNTKEHIIEILGKMITNPKTMGSVFAIHGEAGTGKTTLIKEGLSHVFGLPFVFISLGGAQDRSFLTGSNYVYEGSCCGKILQALKQAKCMNPIFYFDELDKISSSEKGIEIMNLLIHLTDYTQNSHFVDDYMDGISVDLSRATFVFSFNDKRLVSPILLDRMEIIKFKSYSAEHKMHIARNYLLPNIVKNVFGPISHLYNFIISDELLYKIVVPDIKYKSLTNKSKKNKKQYNYKPYNKKTYNKRKIPGGVRYIKKKLEKLLSRINVEMIAGGDITLATINGNYDENISGKVDIVIRKL